MRGSNFRISSLEEDLKDLGILDSASSPSEGAAANGDLGEATKTVTKFIGRRAVKTKQHKMVGQEKAAARRKSRKGSVKAARKLSRRRKMRSRKYRRMLAYKAAVARKKGTRESLRQLKHQTLAFISEARNFMESRHPQTVAESVSPFIRARSKYGVSHIAEELEELSRLTSQVASFEAQDVVKGFANIALIAEKMSERFEALAEVMADYALDEEMMAVSEVYAQLAEDASKLAKGLNESDAAQFDFAGLTQAFRSQMQLLLQGLDIYGNLVEGDDAEGADAEDEGADDEDSEDEEDEDGEDEDEDEDEDEEDEDEGED